MIDTNNMVIRINVTINLFTVFFIISSIVPPPRILVEENP